MLSRLLHNLWKSYEKPYWNIVGDILCDNALPMEYDRTIPRQDKKHAADVYSYFVDWGILFNDGIAAKLNKTCKEIEAARGELFRMISNKMLEVQTTFWNDENLTKASDIKYVSKQTQVYHVAWSKRSK